MISFWLGNLWSSIVEWAWILLAIAAVLSLATSALLKVLPFPALRSYGGALLVGGIVLVAASANIQGRASSSAAARLAETQRQLAEAQRINFNQAAEIERQRRVVAENDAALVKMAEEILAADAAAEAEKAKRDELERTDETVSEYLSRPVPAPLGRMLVPEGAR